MGFDTLKNLNVVLRDESDGFTGTTCTGSTTDTVDVVFRICRHVVVDDEIDERNVKTTRSNVGGHQNASSTGFKLVQTCQSEALGHLAMQWDGWETETTKDNG